MRPWKHLTNEELALHLDIWLRIDGSVTTEWQREYFDEIIWRLRLTEEEDERRET